MNKILMIGSAAVICAAAVGCSQEDREEAMTRLGKAGRALNGEVMPDDGEYAEPKIVVEQRRKERIRQNTKWTMENQAKHPIEYCQAQLEEVTKYGEEVEAVVHKLSVSRVTTERTIKECGTKEADLRRFLDEAKAAYRAAEAKNEWPVKIGGFSLTKERTQEKIVDAAARIPSLKARSGKLGNMLVSLDKKQDAVRKEQRKLVLLKERIENTISDLKVKKVIEGEQGIADALNAINDSMQSLGVDYDDPSVEMLMAPDKASEIKVEFDKIMAE